MHLRLQTLLTVGVLFIMPSLPFAQSSEPLRTPWGDPDIGGVWDYWTFTPLERPDEFECIFVHPESVTHSSACFLHHDAF